MNYFSTFKYLTLVYFFISENKNEEQLFIILSMGLLLKIILIIVLVLYIIGQVGRFLLKRILKNLIDKEIKRQETYYEESERRNRKEGDIHVDHIPEKEKHQRKKNNGFRDGDYIDFEEM